MSNRAERERAITALQRVITALEEEQEASERNPSKCKSGTLILNSMFHLCHQSSSFLNSVSKIALKC